MMFSYEQWKAYGESVHAGKSAEMERKFPAILSEYQRLFQVMDGTIEEIKALMCEQPHLIKGMRGHGCMSTAVGTGRTDVVELLLQHGGDINESDSFDSTLSEAARGGNVEMLAFLLDHGADPTKAEPYLHPLICAVSKGQVEIVKFLVQRGLGRDVHYRRDNGEMRTALSFALDQEQTEIAEILKQAGYPMPDPSAAPPPEELADSFSEEITSYLSAIYGEVDSDSLQEIVPVHSSVHVRIHVIRPNKSHKVLTLFTTGMSDAPMNVPAGQEEFQFAELIIHLPAKWPHPKTAGDDPNAMWPIRWMRDLAYFPHLQETWLGGQFTIVSSDDPPVPLGPNCPQTCWLLLSDFSRWSPITLSNGKLVRYYTMIPLFTDERDFEKKHGIIPLIQKLNEKGETGMVNVRRKSVIGK